MEKKILISTGGSGGHVVPATILYEHLKDKFQVSLSTDIRGLKFLNKEMKNFEVFNIGTGKGFSVLEVIAAFEAATGEKVPHSIGPRRSGDIVAVWAETSKVTNILAWSASRNLDTMMRDAWNWQLANGK